MSLLRKKRQSNDAQIKFLLIIFSLELTISGSNYKLIRKCLSTLVRRHPGVKLQIVEQSRCCRIGHSSCCLQRGELSSSQKTRKLKAADGTANGTRPERLLLPIHAWKLKLLFRSVTENIGRNVRSCDFCKFISVHTTVIMVWMRARLALWLFLHSPFFTKLLNRT